MLIYLRGSARGAVGAERAGGDVHRSSDGDLPGVRDGDRDADIYLFHWIYEGGLRVLPVFCVHEPVRVLYDGAGHGEQLHFAVPGLGGGGAVELPLDRVLLSAAVGGGGGEEGVHHEPDRGLRVWDRDFCDLPGVGDVPVLRRGERGAGAGGDGAVAGGGDDADEVHSVSPDAGGVREVGAVSVARVAAGRDGGSDAGVGVDSCGDDGDGGGVHDRAVHAAVQSEPGGAGHGGGDRVFHGVSGCVHRYVYIRSEAGVGVFDAVAVGVHVPGAGGGGDEQRGVPRVHARLVQGAAVFGGGVRDACDGRGVGHAEDVGDTEVHAQDDGADGDRVSGAGGVPGIRGVFLEGPDHRGGDQPAGGIGLGAGAGGDADGVDDGVLHVPAVFPGVFRAGGFAGDGGEA